jgi:hypothetical protein
MCHIDTAVRPNRLFYIYFSIVRLQAMVWRKKNVLKLKFHGCKDEHWIFPINILHALYHWVTSTEYIFYCKRAILCLASSKILTPHPPLRLASVYPPPLLRGEDRLAGTPGGEGDGGSIFWKTREIGLPSYSKICTLWSPASLQKL